MAENESEQSVFLLRKQCMINYVFHLIKRAEKRLAEREKILLGCLEWAKVAHVGQLLQSNLYRIRKGMSSIDVEDWEVPTEEASKIITIHLDPLKEVYLQVSDWFKRSRKLRIGEIHARRMLKCAEDDMILLLCQAKTIESKDSLIELELYCSQCHIDIQRGPQPTEIKRQNPARQKPYNSYKTELGMEIWVGRNARCNDLLTFHYAKGSDWWFHAKNYSGSHVVLRCSKNQEPDTESMKMAAKLALQHSKAKENGQGDVTVTQVKWLKRVKSIPGRVTVSQSKVMHATLS